jgi:hypothetical protein
VSFSEVCGRGVGGALVRGVGCMLEGCGVVWSVI